MAQAGAAAAAAAAAAEKQEKAEFARLNAEFSEELNRLKHILTSMTEDGLGNVQLQFLQEAINSYHRRFEQAQKDLNVLSAEKSSLAVQVEDFKGQIRRLEDQLRFAREEKGAEDRRFEGLNASLGEALSRAAFADSKLKEEVLLGKSLRAQVADLNREIQVLTARLAEESRLHTEAANHATSLQETLHVREENLLRELRIAKEEEKRIARLVDNFDSTAQEAASRRVSEALLAAQRSFELEVVALRDSLLAQYNDRLQDHVATAQLALRRDLGELQVKYDAARSEVHILRESEGRLRHQLDELLKRQSSTPLFTKHDGVAITPELLAYRRQIDELHKLASRKRRRGLHVEETAEHVNDLVSLTVDSSGALHIETIEHGGASLVVKNVSDRTVRTDKWHVQTVSADGETKNFPLKRYSVKEGEAITIAAGVDDDAQISIPDLAKFPVSIGSRILLLDDKDQVSSEARAEAALSRMFGEVLSPQTRTT